MIMLELPSLVLVTVLTLTSKTDKVEAIVTLVVVASIMALAMALLMNIKLETRIDEKGIHYKYFPFVKWRLVGKSQIRQVKVESFNPLMDHGGWGLKGNKTTKVYTVIGDHGLSIDLGEKKKTLIGTQKPKELRDFIENWMEE